MSNPEVVGIHRNDCEAIRKTENTSDTFRKNVNPSYISGTIAIEVLGDRKDPNRQNK